MNSKDVTIRRLRKFIEVMFVAQKEKESVLFEENECLNQKIEKLNDENDILRKVICEFNEKYEDISNKKSKNHHENSDDEGFSEKKSKNSKKTTFAHEKDDIFPSFKETLLSSSSAIHKTTSLPREIEPLTREFQKMENENKKLRKINKKLTKMVGKHEDSLHNLRKEYIKLAERKASEEAKMRSQIERLQKLTIETTNEIKWLSECVNDDQNN